MMFSVVRPALDFVWKRKPKHFHLLPNVFFNQKITHLAGKTPFEMRAFLPKCTHFTQNALKCTKIQ